MIIDIMPDIMSDYRTLLFSQKMQPLDFKQIGEQNSSSDSEIFTPVSSPDIESNSDDFTTASSSDIESNSNDFTPVSSPDIESNSNDFTPASSPELKRENTSDVTVTKFVRRKQLNLEPSCFLNGCVCGHHLDIRDMVYDTRKRKINRCSGVTIRPKTPPILVRLKHK
jgi:hypothetical protein